MDYVLTIDIGTTSTKVALFNRDGSLIKYFTQEYKLLYPAPNIVELSAEQYWSACKKGIQSILDSTRIEPKLIKGMSFSSQAETLVPVGRDGIPLRKAIVWLDNRAIDEARIIRDEFGLDRIHRITGQPEVVPTWPACRILWIKRNEPSLFKEVYKFLLLEDYLIYRLTGRFVEEYSLASSSLMLDITEKKWWQEMLNFVGITEDKLPLLMESGTPLAHISRSAARETRLSEETLVVIGALDQAAGAIGAGNIKPGITTETTGGVLAICASINKPIIDPLRRVPCHCHAVPDTYLLLAWCQTAGIVLKWFRDEFFSSELDNQDILSGGFYEKLEERITRVPAGCEGLVVLPYLMGASCPHFNPSARGVFYGVSLKHTRAYFLRAIMEAIAFMLKENIELMKKLGIETRQVISMGGGSRSIVWTQMKADVLNLPVIRLETSEVASVGAAVLAAKGIGWYSSVEKAIQVFSLKKDTISPHVDSSAIYTQTYQKYLDLYEILSPTF